jgi:type IV pilus assembly protein PilQ
VERVTTTRFLSYARAKDVTASLKKMLTQRGTIEADDRTNGLIITDVPSVMGPIDALIAQLDRKTQEVEIEARVVAATRNFARDIGTQLGFAWANAASSVGGLPGQAGLGISPVTVNYAAPPGYVTTPAVAAGGGPGSIPLFSNQGLKSATSGLGFVNLGGAYRLDAFLALSENRGLAKILSRPRVITQNNVQAIIKQGQRIPSVTAAQLQGPPTVTYIEALLRLTVTPQITVENTIFLNVDIENTTADFTNRVGDNPVLFTQQTTTQVLVTNGGTVVIGGVVQTQNQFATQQVPLLGSVPVLGNLFKRRSVSTNTQELIFFITPRIIET